MTIQAHPTIPSLPTAKQFLEGVASLSDDELADLHSTTQLKHDDAIRRHKEATAPLKRAAGLVLGHVNAGILVYAGAIALLPVAASTSPIVFGVAALGFWASAKWNQWSSSEHGPRHTRHALEHSCEQLGLIEQHIQLQPRFSERLAARRNQDIQASLDADSSPFRPRIR